jgi:hypothetical protein
MWEAIRVTNTGGTTGDDSAIYFTHYTDDRLQAFIKDDIGSSWDCKLHFGTTDSANNAATKMTLDGDEQLGIGTETPDYTLDVAGTVGIDSYIYHNGDGDTYLKFTGNEVNIVAGAKSMITLDYNNNTNDKIILNNTNEDIDVQIMADDNAVILHTDAATNRVGIGTTAPTSTLHVSGSQAGNLVDTAVNLTLNETHFMVSITQEVTGTLPASNGCGGRIYHIFNQAGGESGGSIEISCSSGDRIDGQGTLTIDSTDLGGGNSSVSLVSNGGDGWLIFGQYSPQEG